jgi:hypothetical protein
MKLEFVLEFYLSMQFKSLQFYGFIKPRLNKSLQKLLYKYDMHACVPRDEDILHVNMIRFYDSLTTTASQSSR